MREIGDDRKVWSGVGSGRVLGEGFHSPSLLRKWHNTIGRVRIKTQEGTTFGVERNTPRPNKTRLTLERLRQGLRGFVPQNEMELDPKMRLSPTTIEPDMAWTRPIDPTHLQRTLDIVESLLQRYSKLMDIREGVRCMAYAYSKSLGPTRESALSRVKAGFRECSDELCAIEKELQKLVGQIKLEIKGIQGFSRLCGGDVFEVCLRHGDQKWKARGRVAADGKQTWDIPKGSFHGIFGEVIDIKAAELKIFGKVNLLGNKFCEITELFSADNQLMTVNLNPSGSLKLHLVINWCPPILPDDCEVSVDDSYLSARCRCNQRFGQCKCTRTPKKPNQAGKCKPVRDSTAWAHMFSFVNNTQPTSNSTSNSNSTNSEAIEDCKVSENSDKYLDACETSIEESLLRLATTLEDLQGHFPELEPLHSHSRSLIRLYMQPSAQITPPSLINVDGVLDCFDFLDAEDTTEKSESDCTDVQKNKSTHEIPKKAPISSEAEESYAMAQKYEPVVKVHVQIILKLTQRLGLFGPLRAGEEDAIRKLSVQASILAKILNVLFTGRDIQYPTHIEDLWNKICQTNLTISAEIACGVFGSEAKDFLAQGQNNEVSTDRLSHCLIDQILDNKNWNVTNMLTKLHLENFFRHTTLDIVFREIIEKEILLNTLRNVPLVSGLDKMSTGSIPPKDVLECICRRLAGTIHGDEYTAISAYLIALTSTASNRQQIEKFCAEMLESDQRDERGGSCLVFGIIKSVTMLEILTYVRRTDVDQSVKAAAEKALQMIA